MGLQAPPLPIRLDRIAGVLLGTAVGDALGVPREGLSPRRARRLFGPPPLRHCLLAGRGLTSDDTEHTCLLAQALLRQPDDPDCFAAALAWGLRGWFLTMPAGIGLATLRACLKLCVGFPPRLSGVWSAGNGPAMRSALLGVTLGHDPERLRAFVRASTRLTHTDLRAERGALLIALAAHLGANRNAEPVTAEAFLTRARQEPLDDELLGLLAQVETHLQRGAEVEELARALHQERGVTGYIYRTVPVVLFCWLRWLNDFRTVVEKVIAAGGDADTTGAIAGALAGASLGACSIPEEWLERLVEWPRSVAWMRRLAERLVEQFPADRSVAGPPVGPLPLFWPGLLPRNLLFLAVVLGHALRRLLPPY
jgi:ADP-ribosylglycohydrolase